jgi:DNA primase
MQPSPVEQVRAAVDIVRLVSQHVALKKAGRTFKALCPFHGEKTPSFVVFPETGRWHCFGCGEGGDAFTFLMKIESLTFPEALRRLADEAGIAISHSVETRQDREGRERLYAANEAAAVFYHGLLLNSPPARAYIAERGITDATLRTFMLGLAPEASTALQNHLKQAGYTIDEMLAAGLLYENEDGPPRDRYRGRLIFPIRDPKGRIVSFGGRALAAGQQPKYLNGPQTPLFDKGATLYGLHAAAAAIKRERRAVVVEGYVDVVIAHQGGFENVVATLGTSLTERHVQELRRLAPQVCLALDADKAGQTASQRGGTVGPQAVPGIQIGQARRGAESLTTIGRAGLARPLLGFERISITVAVLPDGKDPDEVILSDPAVWQTAVEQARPVMEQAIAWAAHEHDIHSLEGKREAADALLPLLGEIADPIARAHYVEMAAHELHIDARALAERLSAARKSTQRAARPDPSAASRPAASRPAARSSTQLQEYAIALALAAARKGLPVPPLDPLHFTDPDLRALLESTLEIIRGAHADWRPEPLDEIDDPWLEGAVNRVRRHLETASRLPEAEIESETAAVEVNLRQSYLALEHSQLQALIDDVSDESRGPLLQRIALNARARAELAATPAIRAGAARAPIIPWRYLAAAPSTGADTRLDPAEAEDGDRSD